MTNFVGIWLKIDFIMKGIILMRIYLRFGCFKLLLLTRVDSSVMHKTRVGTLKARGSTTMYLPLPGFEPTSSMFLDEC